MTEASSRSVTLFLPSFSFTTEYGISRSRNTWYFCPRISIWNRGNNNNNKIIQGLSPPGNPQATHGYLRGFVAKACPGDRGISALSRFSQTSPGELPMGFAEPAVSRFSGNTSHGRESYQNCQGDCLFYISFKFARKKSHPPPENGAKTCVLLHFLSRWSEFSNLKSHHHLKLYCVGE